MRSSNEQKTQERSNKKTDSHRSCMRRILVVVIMCKHGWYMYVDGKEVQRSHKKISKNKTSSPLRPTEERLFGLILLDNLLVCLCLSRVR